MSQTDLEEDLRATFERAAASVPFAPDLVSRAKTDAVQYQRRAWMTSGLAAAAVLVVATVVALQAGGPSSLPEPAASPTVQTSTTQKPTAPPALLLIGSWRPVQVSKARHPGGRPEDPVLTFSRDGAWTGSDGCNSLGGRYTVGPRGQFTSTERGQRMAECSNVPNGAVMMKARRVAVDDQTLEFFDAKGSRVAVYARSK